MNLNKNYYGILQIEKDADTKQIKKQYYALSMKHHPDKGGDEKVFDDICQAYKTLTNDREAYDKKSKYGANYNEFIEFFNIDIDFDHVSEKSKYQKFKEKEVLDIIIEVDGGNFDGTLEFARYVMCKKCQGTGKDNSTRIAIKNDRGEVKYFDGDEGCDFCDGSGKDFRGNECGFCKGKGKVGLNPCKTCNGDRRILGKQRVKDIKLEGDETVIKSMGHISYYDTTRSGSLIIRKQSDKKN